MRIRKLDLFGFKSFPDRTTFEFGPGISCVVGPNGSGKSNVVDALRWCIGEQSARSLRGAEMADVIFAGSAARSPVGFAEVTLTLSSDGGEPFPGDFARFEEIEVGRRLYRDGTSEYLINQVKCRRRDIVDLFLDTGVGANLYSFIAQGQVDRIVSQSAAERRSLIDEAAGITRYKARREEAMARLAATAAQLDRAADVSDEMGRRLRSLEKQVIKAGRFRRARARIRQREIALGVVKYGAMAEDRRALREDLRRAKDDAGALTRSVERLSRELDTRTEEVRSVREALQKWREEAAELEAQRREAEGARRLQDDRHRELLEAVERARERVEKARADTGAANAERAAAEAERIAAAGEGGDEAVDRARQARERAATELSVVRDRARRLRDAEAGRLERLRGLEEESSRLELALVGLESEPLAEAAPEGGDRESERAEREMAVGRARERAREVRGTLTEAREALAAAEAEAQARRENHEAALAAWEADRSEREQRRDALRRGYAAAAREARSQRQRRREQALSEARERAGRWIAALRARSQARASRLEAAHREALAAVRAEVTARLAALRSEEESALAAVERDLDRSRVEAATAAVEAARAEGRRLEGQRREASEEAARQRGVLRALEAEFAELEARREAAIPEAWRERPLLADRADGADPRRVARPELLGLPVVEAGDLGDLAGRAVLAGTAAPWRVVDTLEEAIAVLATHGPPVASRDGRLRVDPDGLVELGPRRDPQERWVEVRDALPPARDAVEAAEAREASLAADEQGAHAELERAREALESAESALVRARESGLAEVRERFVAAVRAAEADREAGEQARFEAHDHAAAELSEETRRELAEAEASRDRVLAALPAPMATEPWLRAAMGRAWPGPVGPRPVPGEVADLSALRAAVREREIAVERADADVAAASAALEAVREAMREAERVTAQRQAAREARQEEARRTRARLDEVRGAIARSEPDPSLPAAEESLEHAERALGAADDAWREVEARTAARREREAAAAARIERAEAAIEAARASVADGEAEIVRSTEAASDALKSAEVAKETAGRLAVQRAEVLSRVERDQTRLDKLSAEHQRVRASLDEARERAVRADAEQGELEQRVQTLQLEIEAIRKRLGDRYQVSLPGLLDRLWMRKRLVIEPDEGVQETLRVRDVELEPVEALSIGVAFADDADRIKAMVEELEALRQELASISEVNLAAEEEYRELDERWRDLQTQTEDLEASVKSIRQAIAKMNRTCRERFRDAYDRVNEAFQESYPKLVGGGDARLALTDEEDLLETGVDIFVRPPGKRLQNLTLLSGGEKAMTAIALLLALFRVKPSPFCVLDEVDAPLDEANGARFNDMVREMSSLSQFIVITHNRKTMECADVLYGVTMAHPGVSTLVSVALDA